MKHCDLFWRLFLGSSRADPVWSLWRDEPKQSGRRTRVRAGATAAECTAGCGLIGLSKPAASIPLLYGAARQRNALVGLCMEEEYGGRKEVGYGSRGCTRRPCGEWRNWKLDADGDLHPGTTLQAWEEAATRSLHVRWEGLRRGRAQDRVVRQSSVSVVCSGGLAGRDVWLCSVKAQKMQA